jgi:hypothetical protein
MEKIITLELDSNRELVEMHLNKAGAEYLLKLFQSLAQSETDTDCHLMTPEWGGNELTEDAQNLGGETKLINHLKILYWAS